MVSSSAHIQKAPGKPPTRAPDRIGDVGELVPPPVNSVPRRGHFSHFTHRRIKATRSCGEDLAATPAASALTSSCSSRGEEKTETERWLRRRCWRCCWRRRWRGRRPAATSSTSTTRPPRSGVGVPASLLPHSRRPHSLPRRDVPSQPNPSLRRTSSSPSSPSPPPSSLPPPLPAAPPPPLALAPSPPSRRRAPPSRCSAGGALLAAVAAPCRLEERRLPLQHLLGHGCLRCSPPQLLRVAWRSGLLGHGCLCTASPWTPALCPRRGCKGTGLTSWSGMRRRRCGCSGTGAHTRKGQHLLGSTPPPHGLLLRPHPKSSRETSHARAGSDRRCGSRWRSRWPASLVTASARSSRRRAPSSSLPFPSSSRSYGAARSTCSHRRRCGFLLDICCAALMLTTLSQAPVSVVPSAAASPHSASSPTFTSRIAITMAGLGTIGVCVREEEQKVEEIPFFSIPWLVLTVVIFFAGFAQHLASYLQKAKARTMLGCSLATFQTEGESGEAEEETRER